MAGFNFYNSTIKFYLPGYIKEKGKNLATKEDIAGITDQIEQVKAGIIMMAHGAIELKMPPSEFRKRLEAEYSKGLDLNAIRENVGRYYDTLYNVASITAEADKFFQLMKDHIKLSGNKKNAPRKS
ncbi:hypothetical protein V7V80_15945 [Pseudomonas kermanshahensis]|uniref:Uncharacterized protein n=1 Tax=Pseudomonas kermanshahensis TaxID=2745482 RepID=A0ABU8R8G7_9PSED